MPSTTGYRQGDIVLVSFPFTDLTSTKGRPAVVVSPNNFNARNEDVVLVAVTSQVARNGTTVVVARSDVMDGALPKPSVVRLAVVY
jgi:mRNA interferase MazF